MTYLGDTSNHVVDKRFEGIDRAGLLVATEPYANADESSGSLLGRLLHLFELTSDVGEVFGKGTSLTLDSNLPCVYFALNYRQEQVGKDHEQREYNQFHIPLSGI